MKIDSLIVGTEIVEVSPVQTYEDGKPTNVQQQKNNAPLWKITVAVQDGVFVLPVSVKVPHPVELQPGANVRFQGVEVNVFNGRTYFAAEAVLADFPDSELEKVLV